MPSLAYCWHIVCELQMQHACDILSVTPSVAHVWRIWCAMQQACDVWNVSPSLAHLWRISCALRIQQKCGLWNVTPSCVHVLVHVTVCTMQMQHTCNVWRVTPSLAHVWRISWALQIKQNCDVWSVTPSLVHVWWIQNATCQTPAAHYLIIWIWVYPQCTRPQDSAKHGLEYIQHGVTNDVQCCSMVRQWKQNDKETRPAKPTNKLAFYPQCNNL